MEDAAEIAERFRGTQAAHWLIDMLLMEMLTTEGLTPRNMAVSLMMKALTFVNQRIEPSRRPSEKQIHAAFAALCGGKPGEPGERAWRKNIGVRAVASLLAMQLRICRGKPELLEERIPWMLQNFVLQDEAFAKIEPSWLATRVRLFTPKKRAKAVRRDSVTLAGLVKELCVRAGAFEMTKDTAVPTIERLCADIIDELVEYYELP
jgi:hypothetical protein